MKTTNFKIEGMSCMACVSSIEKELYSIAGVKQVSINLSEKQAEVLSDHNLAFPEISKAVRAAGEYTAIESTKATISTSQESDESSSSYKPLVLIALYLVISTLLIEFSSGMFLLDAWMSNFMAGFFIVFSFFKMLDIKGFASAYRMYDLVAARSKWYAYAFPFIELGIGFAYILIPDNPVTHIITAIIMFVSLLGVILAVTNKKKIKCACLGTGFNLPMSTVTIIEDGIMLLMAVFMYFNTL